MTPNWQKIPCAVFNRLYIKTKAYHQRDATHVRE